MKEITIQDYYTNLLTARGIEYIHIPSSAFKGKWKHKSLKYQPDIFFLYNGILYLREIGIKGRHLSRKSEQMKKMTCWSSEGADIAIILSVEAAKEDLEKIGLIETLSK